jgi:hypothetical protein
MIELASKKFGLMHFDEFSGIMSRFEKSYMVGGKELMTELFEAAWFTRKIKGGEDIVIDDPAISILSSTTMDWFSSKVLEEDINGGWLNRFVYCLVNFKPRDWSFPKFEYNPCEYIVLRDELRFLSKLKGELTFSEIALEKYDKFYKRFEKVLENKNDRVKNLYVRLPLYCLKFACLYALNRMEKVGEVSEEDMEKAIKLCDWLLECSYHDTSTRFLTDRSTKLKIRAFNAIQKAGKKGIDRTNLYRGIGVSKKYLEEALETLQLEGRIKKIENLNQKTARNQITYICV